MCPLTRASKSTRLRHRCKPYMLPDRGRERLTSCLHLLEAGLIYPEHTNPKGMGHSPRQLVPFFKGRNGNAVHTLRSCLLQAAQGQFQRILRQCSPLPPHTQHNHAIQGLLATHWVTVMAGRKA